MVLGPSIILVLCGIGSWCYPGNGLGSPGTVWSWILVLSWYCMVLGPGMVPGVIQVVVIVDHVPPCFVAGL